MIKGSPLISIVVPMHNSEMYISRCIKSIIKQDYDNFELLLIDDHSSDDTIGVCQKFVGDSRIRIIINDGKKGASATRNIGIKKATGAYLTFIDSDDVVAHNYLSTLHRIAERNLDYLATCGYMDFSDPEILFQEKDGVEEELVSSSVCICNIFYYHSSACACLFKTNIIKQYNLFMEEKASFNEDVFFTCKYLSICKGAAITKDKLYGYYINPSGIGAHKDHADLTLADVDHRAEGYIALQDAIRFTEHNAPDMKKYIQIGYVFIAAEVRLTAARANVQNYTHDKEIARYLSVKYRILFNKYGKNIMQKMLVNGIAISPKFVKFILDDLKLLSLVK
ncbi:glycosyltransferase family 2 protein [Oribacterium sp. P6A1]|uniref:glycosyltransferase family 2 protein n=1 Tax=Oribacterium sp. P6A1 TaxID=1410612 RepID=UPI00068F6576|nr:glycosyltransferase family A protein [Oribacterium sp. P6A1]